MIKTILAILFFAGSAHAGVPYWQPPMASTSTAYGTGYLSGLFKVYPATTTAAASPSIMLDGVNRQVTARNGAAVTTMSATGFYGNGSGLTNAYNAAYAAALSTAVYQNGNHSLASLGVGTVTVTGASGGYGLTVSSNVSLAGVAYTANGRVGIGKAPNGYALSIAGALDLDYDQWLKFNGTNVLYSNASLGTYIRQPGAVPFQVQTSAGAALLTVLNTGNVGIGTTAPAEELHVQGPDNTVILSSGISRGMFRAFTAVPGNLSLEIWESNAATSLFGSAMGGWSTLYTSLGSGLKIGTINALPVVFGTNSAENMRITSGGNVGVGTTSPKSALQIGAYASIADNGNTSDWMGNLYYSAGYKRTNASLGSLLQQYAGDYHFYTTGTGAADSAATLSEKMTILNGGNVGIGVTAPEAVLHIKNTVAKSTMVSIENTGGDTAWLRFHSGATTMGSINRVGNDLTINPWTSAGLILAENGRPVGIGISPTAQLHLDTDLRNTAVAKIGNIDGSYDRGLTVWTADDPRPGAVQTWRPSLDLSVGDTGGYAYAGKMRFSLSANGAAGKTSNTMKLSALSNADAYATEADVMTWQGNGKVGVGMSTPTRTLDVAGILTTSKHYEISGSTVLSASALFANGNLSVGEYTGSVWTSEHNTFVGYDIANTYASGSDNTYLGYYAGRNSNAGQSTVALGASAGYYNAGIANTFVGTGAGFANTSGGMNVLIGFGAGDSITTGESNIVIGSYKDVPSATASGQLNIGDLITGLVATSSVTVQGSMEATAGFALPSFTTTQLSTRTARKAGTVVYNSSYEFVCFSTGTAAGSWMQMSSPGSACD